MKEYLPLGSVVLLKGGTKPIMIYGRKQISVNDGKIFDYVACFYPEGNISDRYTFLFDHSDVETVIHKGYSDKADEAFLKVLNGQEDNDGEFR